MGNHCDIRPAPLTSAMLFSACSVYLISIYALLPLFGLFLCSRSVCDNVHQYCAECMGAEECASLWCTMSWSGFLRQCIKGQLFSSLVCTWISSVAMAQQDRKGIFS